MRPLPTFLMCFVLGASTLHALPASTGALRLFGTGTGFIDRVVIPIDDNAAGPDASRPIDVGSAGFTVDFWVRGTTADNASPSVAAGSVSSNFDWILGNIVVDRDIWSNDPVGASRDWGVSFRGGRVSFGTGFSSNNVESTLNGAATVLDGQWHHVAVVRDASTGRKLIYVDRVLDQQSGTNVSRDDISFPDAGMVDNQSPYNNYLVLGAEKHDAGTNYPSFRGYLDEVRVWNTALSAVTLTQVWNRVVAPSQNTNLVGYWRFEETSGTTVLDSAWGGGSPGELRSGVPGNGERVSAVTTLTNTAPVGWQNLTNGPLTTRLLATNLSRPVYVTAPPGDTNRLFILEQHTGLIRIYDKALGQMLPTPYLTVPSLASGPEQGLLGLAFHPGWQTNPVFFVSFNTNTTGASMIRRYAAASPTTNVALSGSGTNIFTLAQPFANHNGGWIGFSPRDGYLYVALGDGGSGGDPGDRALDITGQLLGKILRLDINVSTNYAIPVSNPFVGVTGDDEIWAYGLRNPWRCSFDRLTGDFWIGDVGQNSREEVDFQAADSAVAVNYGWRMMEGTLVTTATSSNATYTNNFTPPLVEYPHASGTNGGFSITGGYVYRGSSMPLLQGTYFYADYVNGNVWTLQKTAARYTNLALRNAELPGLGGVANSISSFGEDSSGELYALYHANGTSGAGRLYQITQPPWFLWQGRYFSRFDLNDPGVSGPGADPDGDGLSNLAEYGGNSSPFQVTTPAVPGLGQVTSNSVPYFAVTFFKNAAATDITYAVEATFDLGQTNGWSSSGLLTLTNTPSQLTVRDNIPVPGTQKRFFRMKVSRP